MAHFQMGSNTLAVPMTLFRDNRRGVCGALRNEKKLSPKSYILLKGGKDISIYDTDIDYLFQQESNFQYMFGVKEPGCFGVINVTTSEATLFVPRHPPEHETWVGPKHTLEDFKTMYEVDNVLYKEQLNDFFDKRNPDIVLTLKDINCDDDFVGIEGFVVDSNSLRRVMSECRSVKSLAEIEVLRYVAAVSADAHLSVMRNMRPGQMEYEAESLFLHHCYSKGGCRYVAYTSICGCGPNSAILHYGTASAPNNKQINDGDLCVMDMGGRYCGYTADITCTYPANGKFTEDQKFIYNAVLAANRAVIAQLREGVFWSDMHRLAGRTLLEKLKDGGMLKGDIDEMLTAGLDHTFQPHGLGHLVGLDFHDVGEHLKEYSLSYCNILKKTKCPKQSPESLQIKKGLKAGMYLTVEPGCYFIDWLMDKALSDVNLRNFINVRVFERFRKFGGVRIEDDVLITKNGSEVFTKVPRTVDEIERIMSGCSDRSGIRNILCCRKM